jgi:hypothetical protein
MTAMGAAPPARSSRATLAPTNSARVSTCEPGCGDGVRTAGEACGRRRARGWRRLRRHVRGGAWLRLRRLRSASRASATRCAAMAFGPTTSSVTTVISTVVMVATPRAASRTVSPARARLLGAQRLRARGRRRLPRRNQRGRRRLPGRRRPGWWRRGADGGRAARADRPAPAPALIAAGVGGGRGDGRGRRRADRPAHPSSSLSGRGQYDLEAANVLADAGLERDDAPRIVRGSRSADRSRRWATGTDRRRSRSAWSSWRSRARRNVKCTCAGRHASPPSE